MRTLSNPIRAHNLVTKAIQSFQLDLTGIIVLTEAASGPFVLTPIIAAAANAQHVFAVTKDSRFGLASEVKKYTLELAKMWNLEKKITILDSPSDSIISQCHLVTNLGFLRPITKTLIDKLPLDGAISLMWETWEFRKEDLDLEACNRRNLPVLGTTERDERLKTFQYIGHVVQKLLYEMDIEIYRSKFLVLGGGHFGQVTRETLEKSGAEVLCYEPKTNWLSTINLDKIQRYIKDCDAAILVEHEYPNILIGSVGIPAQWLVESGCRLIHVAGPVDDAELQEAGLAKHPEKKIPFGFMTVTTDYVGPKPVIDLHTAGLKVGEALVRGMRQFNSREKAIDFALKNSPAMDFESKTT